MAGNVATLFPRDILEGSHGGGNYHVFRRSDGGASASIRVNQPLDEILVKLGWIAGKLSGCSYTGGAVLRKGLSGQILEIPASCHGQTSKRPSCRCFLLSSDPLSPSVYSREWSTLSLSLFGLTILHPVIKIVIRKYKQMWKFLTKFRKFEEIDRYYNFSSMLIYPIFLFLYDFFIDIFIIPFGRFILKFV